MNDTPTRKEVAEFLAYEVAGVPFSDEVPEVVVTNDAVDLSPDNPDGFAVFELFIGNKGYTITVEGPSNVSEGAN